MAQRALPGSPKLPWAALPPAVRAATEALLGSPVVAAESAQGGFSAGTAARVRCADGRVAFVKAVGTAVNPGTPMLHRRESAAAAALPPEVAAPRLLGGWDDGDWVVLAFELSPGRTPATPWSWSEAVSAMRAVLTLGSRLTPCPWPGAGTAVDLLRDDLLAWSRLAADPPTDLDPWERRHLDRLAALGPGLTAHDGPLAGDTLLHLDLRADNLLLEPDGRVVFVDWPWAARGVAWLDPVTFALDPVVHGDHDPEGLLAAAGWCPVDPDAVTATLLALTGMWAEAMRRPSPPGMPTLRAHQRRFHDAALAWGRRRAGWA